MKQYDPWRPDAPIPPDIFDYIAEYAAQITTFVVVFILMKYFGAWLHPQVVDFDHWFTGLFSR